ncbi:MAG: tetratricopeptide repeat protein [Candidatus Protochlamydia sp.]|nr:tetratricopeptide repeat protein [Candidatus Protochlamydia sp.]
MCSITNNNLHTSHPLLRSINLAENFLQAIKSKNEQVLLHYPENIFSSYNINKNELIKILQDSLCHFNALSPECAYRTAFIFRKLIYKNFNILHPLNETIQNSLLSQLPKISNNDSPLNFEILVIETLIKGGGVPADLVNCFDQICKKIEQMKINNLNIQTHEVLLNKKMAAIMSDVLPKIKIENEQTIQFLTEALKSKNEKIKGKNNFIENILSKDLEGKIINIFQKSIFAQALYSITEIKKIFAPHLNNILTEDMEISLNEISEFFKEKNKNLSNIFNNNLCPPKLTKTANNFKIPKSNLKASIQNNQPTASGFDTYMLKTETGGNNLIHALFGTLQSNMIVFTPKAFEIRKAIAKDIENTKNQNFLNGCVILKTFMRNTLYENNININLILESLYKSEVGLYLEHTDLIARVYKLNIVVFNLVSNKCINLFYKENSQDIDHLISFDGYNHWSKHEKIIESTLLNFDVNSPNQNNSIQTDETKKRKLHSLESEQKKKQKIATDQIIDVTSYINVSERNPTSAWGFYALAKKIPSNGYVNLLCGQQMTRTQLYVKSIELDPNLSMAYFELGMLLSPNQTVHLNTRDLNQKNLFIKAIELNPNHSDTYFCLAQTLSNNEKIQFNKKLYVTKEQLLLKAIEINPLNKNAIFVLAKSLAFNEEIQLNDGTYASKKHLFYKIIKIDPHSSSAYYHLGTTLKPDETTPLPNNTFLTKQQLFLKAIEINPQCFAAYTALGTTLSQGESIKIKSYLLTAQQLHSKSIELNSNYAEAYFNLGKTLSKSGNIMLNNGVTMTQQELYLKSIELNPKYYDAYMELVSILNPSDKVYFTNGASMTNIELHFKCIELNRYAYLPYLNLGNLLEALNLDSIHSIKKQDLFKQAIEINPDCNMAYFKLGLSLVDEGTIALANGTTMTKQELLIKSKEYSL